ncbi:ATP-binding cassette domain-containing protein [Alicyclobacillus kakegawensis]|uniref:ATP-binding cassette domain-containing protein n=1 Tax=Alicyclobacillus kakegawensis TaxID=392012 RepID=UPI0008325EC8|nr:ATP-binding cassette domain-containing protein [Alicyclobacillus kakegawensis]
MDTLGAGIQLQQVDVLFHTGAGPKPVLRQLNLSVARGQWLSVVGPNGSGKSTLARVLAGRLPISKGRAELLIDRQRVPLGQRAQASAQKQGRADRQPDTSRAPGPAPGSTSAAAAPESLVQLIGQNPDAQLVGETVAEDVAFGLENLALPPREVARRTRAAIGQVGLAGLEDRPISTLSGGQKQLVAVAGALAVKPRVLIFDEATSMLDPSSRRNILTVVRRLRQAGVTVVWVTQWLDELALADAVLALRDGEAVYHGSPQGFFYGDGAIGDAAASWCQRLDLTPPPAVAVALRLRAAGWPIGQPLCAEALMREVVQCPSPSGNWR